MAEKAFVIEAVEIEDLFTYLNGRIARLEESVEVRDSMEDEFVLGGIHELEIMRDIFLKGLFGAGEYDH